MAKKPAWGSWGKFPEPYIRFPNGTGLQLRASRWGTQLPPPLQVHCAMSAIANQGIYMQPQLVRRIYDNSGNTIIHYSPRAVRRVISSKIAALMGDMLTDVVSDTGTARRAQIKGFKVAGKTGTSQKIINGAYSNKKHVASFTGFFGAAPEARYNSRGGLPKIKRHRLRRACRGAGI